MEEPSSHAIWQRNLSELGARQRSPGAGSSATSQGHSPARCALGLLQIYRAGTLLALIIVRSWHADTDQGARRGACSPSEGDPPLLVEPR